jgi:integrase/recombinase XerC
MNQPAQNHQIIQKFKKYLKNKDLSDITIKNYLSDLRHFLNWSAKTGKSFLDQKSYFNYKNHLQKQHTTAKSINRYLSTLRKFGRFLKESSNLDKNPAINLENLDTNPQKKKPDLKILNDFKRSLENQDLSEVTIKNYMSDVRQFLEFVSTSI